LVPEGGGASNPTAPLTLRGTAHVLGRSKSCRSVVSHSRVSAQHCVFYRAADGAALLEDLSRYGTFVNGHLIGKGGSAPLADGDVVTLLAPSGPDAITLRVEMLAGGLSYSPARGAGVGAASPTPAYCGSTCGGGSSVGGHRSTSPTATEFSVSGGSDAWAGPSVRRSSSISSCGSPSVGADGPARRLPGPAPLPPRGQYSPGAPGGAPPQHPPAFHHPPSAAGGPYSSPGGSASSAPASQYAPAPQRGSPAQQYSPGRVPPAGPPPSCALPGSAGPAAPPPAAPGYGGYGQPGPPPPGPPPPGTPFCGPSGQYSAAPPYVPPLRPGSSGAASSRARSEGGAPGGPRDVAQDEAWLRLRALQMEASASSERREFPPRNPSTTSPPTDRRNSKPVLARIYTKFRAIGAGKKSRDGRRSDPASSETSPRSADTSPRLTSIQTVDDGTNFRPGNAVGANFRQPAASWERGQQPTILDPVEAKRRAQQQQQGGGGGGGGGPSSVGRASPLASPTANEGFGRLYDEAAAEAMATLSDRASRRGEAPVAHIGRDDFVAALSVIGARLGLAVDEVQLSELFVAVAADASSVHFGEFVGSEATRRFFAHAVYDDEPELDA
jgi:hypothetical protein